jgi:flavin reductase (DIM6/NTAB) family NADH-FMN oxidoreductase RutF
MAEPENDRIVTLPTGGVALWEQVFTVAPLVLVGTVEEDGSADLAPKHQAMPLGWASHYGFVCTARHRTHGNILRTGQFTVSFPTPDQSVLIGQAAAPRVDDEKLSLGAVPTRPATTVDGVLVDEAALWLECELDRVVEGFGEHDLITGSIVAAAAPEWALRDPDVDDADLIGRHPSLAYLCPSRFAPVTESLSFPFPAAFHR